MNLCEFSDIIADDLGISQRCCSDIIKATITNILDDFRALKNVPDDNLECYNFMKEKRLGIRLGPIKLGCELTQLARKKKYIESIRKLKKENVTNRRSEECEVEG